MNRYLIEYCTDGNITIRHAVSRGRNETEAVKRFENRMKHLNVNEYSFEIFRVEEIGNCKWK